MPTDPPSFAIRFALSPKFGQRVIELDFSSDSQPVPTLMVHDLGLVIQDQFWRQKLRASDMARVATSVRHWLSAAITGGHLYLDRIRGCWRYLL